MSIIPINEELKSVELLYIENDPKLRDIDRWNLESVLGGMGGFANLDDYMTNIIYKAESDNLHLKTEYQIKDRIIGIQSEIHELLKERDEYMNKYGGLTKEKDADIKSDIAFKSHEIRILGWVLGIVKITQI